MAQKLLTFPKFESEPGYIFPLCASHLCPLFDPEEYRRVTDMAVERLARHSGDFDSIVVTGLSGTMVGPAIAARLNKGITVVRKSENESPHSDRLVEGTPVQRWLFLDDLICGGGTLRRVIKAINDWTIETLGPTKGVYGRQPSVHLAGVYLFSPRSRDTKLPEYWIGPSKMDQFWTSTGYLVGADRSYNYRQAV